MEKQNEKQSKKLTLNKETLQQLKIKTNVKAGGYTGGNVAGGNSIRTAGCENHNEVLI